MGTGGFWYDADAGEKWEGVYVSVELEIDPEGDAAEAY